MLVKMRRTNDHSLTSCHPVDQTIEAFITSKYIQKKTEISYIGNINFDVC